MENREIEVGGRREALKPVTPKLYREPSDEEVEAAMRQANHLEGEGTYVLLANRFFPSEEIGRKAIGNPRVKVPGRGDLMRVEKEEAERLLFGRAVAPPDSPEARRARLEAAEKGGDKDAARELQRDEIRRQMAELQAREAELDREEEGE